jgi:hypothetical protein
MGDIISGILGGSAVIGMVVVVAINEAKMDLWAKREKESGWWTNKTILGEIIIVLSMILGIVGVSVYFAIGGAFNLWNRYCIKRIS